MFQCPMSNNHCYCFLPWHNVWSGKLLAYGHWFVPCVYYCVRLTYRPSNALRPLGSLRILALEYSTNKFHIVSNKVAFTLLMKNTPPKYYDKSNYFMTKFNINALLLHKCASTCTSSNESRIFLSSHCFSCCLLRMQLATRFTICSYPQLDQAHPFSVSLEVD